MVVFANSRTDFGNLPAGAKEVRAKGGNTIPMVFVTTADGRKGIDAHFLGVLNLVEILDHAVLKALVNIGSSDEYGDQMAPQSEDVRESPISPYSSGKLFSTQFLFLYFVHRLKNLLLILCASDYVL